MNSIIFPALVLMAVTFLVWLTMFIRRVSAANSMELDIQEFAMPEGALTKFDDKTNCPANAYKNLFELPVLFYALCGYLAIGGAVDALTMNLAWAFVALRAIQAFVHCTYNRVMHRFVAFIVSSLILWVMLARALMAYL